MDIIIIGLYSETDIKKINKALLKTNNLKIIWDYQKFNLEVNNGINEMNDFFNLKKTGVLVFDDEDYITSSPIISEVSSYFETTIWKKENNDYPSLFKLFDIFIEVGLSDFILAFANEWEKDTTVKIEKIHLSDLTKRLCSFYVWCDEYFNISANSMIRDDFHPLILQVESYSK